MINKFKIILCLVFVPHQSAPYNWRLLSSVKALDGLKLFIKQVKTENLVWSRTVDVPCFFHFLELARRCSHGSGKWRSSVMYSFVLSVNVKNWKWNSLFTILSKLFFYKTYVFLTQIKVNILASTTVIKRNCIITSNELNWLFYKHSD